MAGKAGKKAVGKTAAGKAAAKNVSAEAAKVSCPCENQTNSWAYGIIIGAAFGALAGAITGNYLLCIPIGVALGIVFIQFFKC